jgi:hypothetical protein
MQSLHSLACCFTFWLAVSLLGLLFRFLAGGGTSKGPKHARATTSAAAAAVVGEEKAAAAAAMVGPKP